MGLGVGEQHAKGYARLANCELRMLYDLDANKAQLVARELGAVAAENFEQILDDPRIDVVSIASFDDAHSDQVLAGLSVGKHLFVEKPLCNTLEELRAIKRAWRKHEGRVKMSSNLVLRAAPVYIWLKEEIEAGEFGEIYAFDGDYLGGRLWKITNGWRRDAKNYSAMKGGGVHLIDLMVWLTGQRPSGVFTRGNGICTRDTEFRGNDFMASTFQFASGLVGRITANLGCVHKHHHVVRIFGTKATFVYDDSGPRIYSSCNPDAEATPIALDTLPRNKADLLPSFVDAVLEDRDLEVHTQQIFDVVSICAACDGALKLNSQVEIEYV